MKNRVVTVSTDKGLVATPISSSKMVFAIGALVEGSVVYVEVSML